MSVPGVGALRTRHRVHRGIVHGVDRHRDGRNVGAGSAVTGGVGEAVAAVEVRVRRVAAGAVGVDHDGSMQCLRDERIGQGLAVDVGCDQRAIERRVLVDGAVAELRHRGVVHRVDRQADGGGVGAAGAVIGREGEAVGAVEVRFRRVGVGAVGVDHDGAVRRLGGKRIGQRQAVDVGRDHGAADRRILVAAGAAVLRHRGIVHRVDRQGDGCGVGAAGAVITVKVKLSPPL